MGSLPPSSNPESLPAFPMQSSDNPNGSLLQLLKAALQNHHNLKNNNDPDFSQGQSSPLLYLAKAGAAGSSGTGVTSPTSWCPGQEDPFGRRMDQLKFPGQLSLSLWFLHTISLSSMVAPGSPDFVISAQRSQCARSRRARKKTYHHL